MIDTDQKGQSFVEVENIRLTYVPQKNRSPEEDWAGEDVIRIQAKKGIGNALHRGAEFPISKPLIIIDLIAGLIELYKSAKNA